MLKKAGKIGDNMTIRVYIEYKIHEWFKDVKRTLTDPKTYTIFFGIWMVISILKGDKLYAMIAFIIMIFLWIWADYRKGRHTYWWRQKYKTKIEGLKVVVENERKDNDREPND